MQWRWIIVAAALACNGARADFAADYANGNRAYGTGDVRAAIALLTPAAAGGHAPSQALMGRILEGAFESAEAAKYYRLAAEQGDPDGLYGLGVLYLSGEGVPRDAAAARGWILKAAEKGHVNAATTVGLAYVRGGLGFSEADRQSREALPWIEKAAANGALDAVDRLAVAYRRGDYGLTPDVKKAEALETRARELRKLTPEKGRKRAKANG
jgi:TPR repeat protein